MKFISSWAEGIIIAVIIATIIEMILPKGNSKKYIKMVLGLFIIFNIINPIANKFTKKEIKIEDMFDNQNYSNSKKYDIYKKNSNNINTNKSIINLNNASNIKEIYILGLKKDIKAKIEDKGFIVHTIKIDVEDNEEYTIKKIELDVQKKEGTEEEQQQQDNLNEEINNVKKIENVNIKVSVNDNNSKKEDNKKEKEYKMISKNEENEIKDLLNQNYQIDKNKIKINT